MITKTEIKLVISKNVCYLFTEDLMYRYLLSNSYGQWNGALKAQCHIALCQFYVAIYRGIELDAVMIDSPEFRAVREGTQKLTNHLDEVIGFPLDVVPDFEKYEPLFFDKFHRFALESLESMI